jgi:CheY-like chemotaxis protein
MDADSIDPEPLILVVDDEREIREMLDFLFAGEGYRVLTAASGKEALVIARDHRVDLMIVDLRMPDLQGDAVCRAYRERGGRPL